MNIIELLFTVLNKRELKTTKLAISHFSKNASKKYRVYSIPKRTAGLRTIAHPSKELKIYQRIISTYFQNILPIHEIAFAYKKGSSIKLNAEAHKKNKYLLKMDFENFFNSITPALFKEQLAINNIKFTAEDMSLIEQLCFWCPSKVTGGKLVLSVGAPVSPVISNFIMYSFDSKLENWCKNKKITYTRYADDITFSTNIKNILFELPKYIEELLKIYFGNQISIKATKTVFSSKAHNRHITGITITNDGFLSIGRERKRYISSLIHKYKLNKLTYEEVEHMKGLLGFAFNIEPLFKEKMIKKYSKETMNQINQIQRNG